MKNYLVLSCALLTLVSFGCTSSGPVLGVCSAVKRHYNIQAAESRVRAKNLQAILEAEAPADRKLLAVQAVNLGGNLGDGFAVGLGFNLTPLVNGTYTGAEVAAQTGWALVDLGVLGGAGYWAYDSWIRPDSEPKAAAAVPAATSSSRGNITTTATASDSAVVNININYVGDGASGGEGGIQ